MKELQIIKKRYKQIGIANLVLSLLGFFIMHDNPERIYNLFATNFRYHLLYHFIIIGTTPFNLVFFRNGQKHLLATIALYFFSYFTILAGILMVFAHVFVISKGELTPIFSIIEPVGLILGGLYLRSNIQREKSIKK